MPKVTTHQRKVERTDALIEQGDLIVDGKAHYLVAQVDFGELKLICLGGDLGNRFKNNSFKSKMPFGELPKFMKEARSSYDFSDAILIKRNEYSLTLEY